MRTNKEWFRGLRAERAKFFLCDLHVHGPASRDLIEGERFLALSEDEKLCLAQARELNEAPDRYE